MATTEADYVDAPLVAPGVVEARAYQTQLVERARDAHTLVCLPTGLGKTAVSLLVTAHRLHETGGTSLLLAPTKPLVQQHAGFYREALALDDDEVATFTGDVRPDDRAALWDDARVVVATPQVVENDLIGGRIDLSAVTHLTFDECHRATGDYAYVYVAERYHADADDPLVTGMSASPGGDAEAIREVCENLGLDEVAVMTEEDADVAAYTHDTDVEWIELDLPDEVLSIRDQLNEVITERLEKLKRIGVTSSTKPDMSETQINRIQGKVQKLMDNDQSEGYEAMSALAEVRKLRTAVTYAETQSVEALRRYFERQRNAARSSGASKASQRMVSDPRVRATMREAESFDDLHPKFRRTRILLAQTLGVDGGDRVIVFTESRDTAEALVDFLSEGFAVRKFVGQGDREGSDGMTQTEQQETLDDFRAGEFEVLVSTSVAEEGLDVPEVDLVLFYEPVPTAIRSIQRKGRTGRQDDGRVVVLMASDTRDEAYFWISKRRETEMAEELRSLKSTADELTEELSGGQRALDEFDEFDDGDDENEGDAADGEDTPDDGDAALADFAAETSDDGERADEGSVAVAGADDAGDAETVELVVDQRELDSAIARDLSTREGIETRLETLAVGDYVVSDRVAVERKSVSDFLDTLLGEDRSLFEQARALAKHYARPVLIVEGGDLYGERNVHPDAIRGAVASLAVDFDMSVLHTEDEGDTADMLAVLAKREQTTRDRAVSAHGEKGAKTLDEQQEYVVSAIAEVGPVTARSLLEHFGTVEAVMTAREDDLQHVEGVGAVTAERVREVAGSDYAPDERDPAPADETDADADASD
ncbi:MAG: DEAD/DEAH box helicase [Haloferacaceae archaeon]